VRVADKIFLFACKKAKINKEDSFYILRRSFCKTSFSGRDRDLHSYEHEKLRWDSKFNWCIKSE